MMSQIRPHFIYNTLGSIEQLCEIDPKKAGELVHNFAKYLRGNFGELDNPRPIQMSQEMEHVQYYLSIEKVRFPDMTFLFELGSVDFRLPALTIQPIVENAVKHGLFHREHGGTLTVSTKTDGTSSIITIADDGIGFDPGSLAAISDGRSHIGIQNVTTRLESMANGTLSLDSTPGVGTTVTITIPFS
jgi:sensor histidine kinase YesM